METCHSNLMNENEEIEKNLGLVISQASRFKPGVMVDKDDYIQAGSIGLLKALRSMDATKGSLSTFSYNAIKNEIIAEINKEKNRPTSYCYVEPSYDLIDNIKEYIPSLSDEQYDILLLRLSGHTYKEIASNYSKSKEWARQTLNDIIEIIKKANEEKTTI